MGNLGDDLARIIHRARKACGEAPPNTTPPPVRRETVPPAAVQTSDTRAQLERISPQHLRFIEDFEATPQLYYSRLYNGIRAEWGAGAPWEDTMTEPARLILLAGPSGSGKTTALLWAARRALEGGRSVAYIGAREAPALERQGRLHDKAQADVLLLDDLHEIAEIGGWGVSLRQIADEVYRDPRRCIVAAGEGYGVNSGDHLAQRIGKALYTRLTDANFGGLLIEERMVFRGR